MQKTEISALTGLRFVAAFSILFLHATAWCVPFNNSRVIQTVGDVIGLYGMPLFFVLSGFVIHYNYGRLFRDRPFSFAIRDFLAARLARIYPLYFFFFMCGAIIDFTPNWIAYAPRAFISYVAHAATLTQSWVYKIVVNQRLLLDTGFGLSWSLSCEFFFYLAYGFFVFFLLSMRRPTLTLLSGILFSAFVLGGLMLCYLHLDAVMAFAEQHVVAYLSPRDSPVASFYRWLFYFSPYVRIWEFALGCLTAQLFATLQGRKISHTEHLAGMILVITAAVSLLVYGLAYGLGLGGPFLVGVIHFFALNFGCAVPIAVIIFCVSRYQSVFTRLLSLPAIVFLGEISYSIYAVHTWTLRPFIRPAVSLNAIYGIDAIFRLSLSIALTLIVATATYAIIEVPCRHYLRSKLRPRSAPGATRSPQSNASPVGQMRAGLETDSAVAGRPRVI